MSLATETTCSPSATSNSVTPWVLRPAIRMSSTGIRITWPRSVTSITWSSSATGKAATTGPLRLEVSMLMIPCPPRLVTRYS